MRIDGRRHRGELRTRGRRHAALAAQMLGEPAAFVIGLRDHPLVGDEDGRRAGLRVFEHGQDQRLPLQQHGRDHPHLAAARRRHLIRLPRARGRIRMPHGDHEDRIRPQLVPERQEHAERGILPEPGAARRLHVRDQRETGLAEVRHFRQRARRRRTRDPRTRDRSRASAPTRTIPSSRIASSRADCCRCPRPASDRRRRMLPIRARCSR